MQQILDEAIDVDRFSGPQLARDLIPVLLDDQRANAPLTKIWGALGDIIAKRTTMGLVRAVFLIEIVNDAITSTKFDRRWSERLVNDPRGSSFVGCIEILVDLLDELADAIDDPTVQELLGRFARFGALPYETPIDYRDRARGHQPGNLSWLFGDQEIVQTLLLRELVSDPSVVGDLTRAFALAGKKTEVKTYLTDRAQTGDFQTNREKRWEAHFGGVQFAYRRDCLKIEHKLLSQICHFDGFPDEVYARLRDSGATVDLELPARCPITRDPLDFELLLDSLEAPSWGRSAFQVGHLNPLKGPGSGQKFGHTPANVAWITADGNRIQGHLSYRETMDLLDRIRNNHENYGPAQESATS